MLPLLLFSRLVQLLVSVQLITTPQAVALQAPLSIFSRQEY